MIYIEKIYSDLIYEGAEKPSSNTDTTESLNYGCENPLPWCADVR